LPACTGDWVLSIDADEVAFADPIAALAMPSDVLRLRHDGYRDADVVTAKARRNALLGELEVRVLESNPASVDERSAVILNLGRSYLGCQRTAEAEAAFAQVRALASQEGRGSHWLWAADFLARPAIDEHRPQDVLAWRPRARRTDSGRYHRAARRRRQ
jgi:hypothetical protein